jgi:plasmid stabilization system protein ParE
MRVRLTATALAELAEILDYIAAENPSAAERVAARFDDTVERLARFPYSAVATDDPSIRMAVLGRYPYLIFYTVADDEVVIRNIRHGARKRP